MFNGKNPIVFAPYPEQIFDALEPSQFDDLISANMQKTFEVDYFDSWNPHAPAEHLPEKSFAEDPVYASEDYMKPPQNVADFNTTLLSLYENAANVQFISEVNFSIQLKTLFYRYYLSINKFDRYGVTLYLTRNGGKMRIVSVKRYALKTSNKKIIYSEVMLIIIYVLAKYYSVANPVSIQGAYSIYQSVVDCLGSIGY